MKSSSHPTSIPPLSLLLSSDSHWRGFKLLFISSLSYSSPQCAGAANDSTQLWWGFTLGLLWLGLLLSSESAESSEEETSLWYPFLIVLCLVLTTRDCSWEVVKLLDFEVCSTLTLRIRMVTESVCNVASIRRQSSLLLYKCLQS